jgi:nitroreductase
MTALALDGTNRSHDSVVLGPAEIEAVGEAARWAPSIHNSQPWSLRRAADGIVVLDDPARSVPLIDPCGRGRTISCGSAVFNARVALRALGYRTAVELPPPHVAGPTGENSQRLADVVAVVRAVGREPATADQLRLAAAIRTRHTHRRIYRSHAVAEEDLLSLRRAVVGEGARLSVADAAARRRLAPLLRQAQREQAEDVALCSEVERWVGRDPDADQASPTVRGASSDDAVEEELARSTVLTVSTAQDTRRDWIVAGLALEHLLLLATTMGLVATFADEPLQNPRIRPEVAQALGIDGVPQVMLRVGRALVEAPVTPRRPLADLFGD